MQTCNTKHYNYIKAFGHFQALLWHTCQRTAWMIWKDAKYVLGNMWETKFQERSSKNHVIHKVNFMVITKVKRLVLPNMLQSEQELHILNPCQVAYPSTPVLWILGHSFLRYEGSKVGNRARFCRNSQSLGGGAYLPHHWSDWPKILDLVLWVPKQHVYQVSLKSETVGFNSLGDLTQNDPIVKSLVDNHPSYTTTPMWIWGWS